jgi:hypothetical protein
MTEGGVSSFRVSDLVAIETGEQLLGFGAREMWLDLQSQWGDARRASMLFRLDVRRVLSVDEMIWRPVFDVDRDLGRPQWTGYVQDLWDSLPRLRSKLEEAWKGEWKPCCLIAVTLVRKSATNNEQVQWLTRTDTLTPATPDWNWRVLGFDVADAFLLSGLSNDGFRPDEDVKVLRDKWGPLLNQCHLFENLEDAENFRRLANIRSAEHAPFFVFCVRLVEAIKTVDPAEGS